jgi:RNA polymerase sigma-70 factor (ECF subfamily)
MASIKETTASVPDSPQLWVDDHGDALFRYALSRLRDQSAAEDVVQETFLAALNSEKAFSGKSSIRTWLIGILKHKIVDHIRRESRMNPVEEVLPEDGLDAELFDTGGRWRNGLRDWEVRPDQLLQRKEFAYVLNGCIEKLPAKPGSAFCLREMENQSTDEICKVLAVTPTHLWVLLHRARIRLQACLDQNWFNPAPKET